VLQTVAATLTQLCFDDLDGPPVVIGSRSWITPAAELEALFFPQPSLAPGCHPRTHPSAERLRWRRGRASPPVKQETFRRSKIDASMTCRCFDLDLSGLHQGRNKKRNKFDGPLFFMINNWGQVVGDAETTVSDPGCPVSRFEPLVWENGRVRGLSLRVFGKPRFSRTKREHRVKMFLAA
jgi:hypothetical protein